MRQCLYELRLYGTRASGVPGVQEIFYTGKAMEFQRGKHYGTVLAVLEGVNTNTTNPNPAAGTQAAYQIIIDRIGEPFGSYPGRVEVGFHREGGNLAAGERDGFEDRRISLTSACVREDGSMDDDEIARVVRAAIGETESATPVGWHCIEAGTETPAQAGHTAGPWKAQGAEVIQGGDREAWQLKIAILPTTIDPRPTADAAAKSIAERDANARLIVSAPDLLRERDALRAALESAELFCTQSRIAAGIGRKSAKKQADFLIVAFAQLGDEIRTAINAAVSGDGSKGVR